MEKEWKMRVVLYTEVRDSLAKYIREAHDQHESIMVMGSKGLQDCVLMSKEDYDTLMENVYIGNSPGWVHSVQKGVSDLDSGRCKALSIEDALGVDVD